MKTFNKKILTTALALGMACGVSGAEVDQRDQADRAYMMVCVATCLVGNAVREFGRTLASD